MSNPEKKKQLHLSRISENDDAETRAAKERRNQAILAKRALEQKDKPKKDRKLEILQEAEELEREVAELKAAAEVES